jgi:hypothetical protein
MTQKSESMAGEISSDHYYCNFLLDKAEIIDYRLLSKNGIGYGIYYKPYDLRLQSKAHGLNPNGCIWVQPRQVKERKKAESPMKMVVSRDVVFSYWGWLKIKLIGIKEGIMAELDIGKGLLAMDLPTMLAELGKAVMQANSGITDFHIPEAEIELKIAIHVQKSSTVGAGATASLYGVGVNASYQSMYGYSAEGASTIRMKLAAGPKQP